jgi:hypothetical protein
MPADGLAILGGLDRGRSSGRHQGPGIIQWDKGRGQVESAATVTINKADRYPWRQRRACRLYKMTRMSRKDPWGSIAGMSGSGKVFEHDVVSCLLFFPCWAPSIGACGVRFYANLRCGFKIAHVADVSPPVKSHPQLPSDTSGEQGEAGSFQYNEQFTDDSARACNHVQAESSVFQF